MTEVGNGVLPEVARGILWYLLSTSQPWYFGWIFWAKKNGTAVEKSVLLFRRLPASHPLSFPLFVPVSPYTHTYLTNPLRHGVSCALVPAANQDYDFCSYSPHSSDNFVIVISFHHSDWTISFTILQSTSTRKNHFIKR